MPQNCKSMSRYSCMWFSTRPSRHPNPHMSRLVLRLLFPKLLSHAVWEGSIESLGPERLGMRLHIKVKGYSLIPRLVGNCCQTVMVPGIGGMIPYCGKLSREKTFITNFEVLWLFAKVFCAKFGGVASFGSTSEQSAKVFSAKVCFHQLTKVFFLESFLLHGILHGGWLHSV